MIGKIIGIIILLVVLYFAWDFIFACCPMFRALTETECNGLGGVYGEDRSCQYRTGMSDTQYKKYLESQKHHQDNPAIRNEQQYNPGKDQYLTDKYQMQNIPQNQRPWNP
jgi:hypothetical protein